METLEHLKFIFLEADAMGKDPTSCLRSCGLCRLVSILLRVANDTSTSLSAARGLLHVRESGKVVCVVRLRTTCGCRHPKKKLGRSHIFLIKLSHMSG